MRTMIRVLLVTIVCAGGLALFPATASASVIQAASGLSSAQPTPTPVSFEAELSISGNILTIILRNNSTQSLAPNDILAGYYFDIIKNGTRPTLALSTVSGQVYVGNKTLTDQLKSPQPSSLVASSTNRGPWEFKVMAPALYPYTYFGVGTAGNGGLGANGFNGNLVDGFDYGVYAGDVSTQNLDGTSLVKGQITFTFTGVSGYSEADISPKFAFTMGTAPDSLMMPEPATLVTLLTVGGFAMLRRRRK